MPSITCILGSGRQEQGSVKVMGEIMFEKTRNIERCKLN
jgi:hypothetical protein